MDKTLLDDIYLTLTGQLLPESAVEGIPNLFAPYSRCDREYTKMRAAYERLCRRLGLDVDDEDSDLNTMVEALEHIQELLCKEMFLLGMGNAP